MSAATLTARSVLLQAGFGDERRQALGFAWALDADLRRAYGADAKGLASARARHLAPFNCQPHAAGLVLGATAALESRAASGDAAAAARIAPLKTALGAGLSGSADALFWGALRPLAAGSSLLVTASAFRFGVPGALALGAAVGLAAFNAPAWLARSRGVEAGLSRGEAAALELAALPARKWIFGARRAALVALVAAIALRLSPTLPFSPIPAAAAFVAGAALSRRLSPLTLALGAGALGAFASFAGWLS